MKSSLASKTHLHAQLSEAGRVIARRTSAEASKTSENSNGSKTIVRSEYTALPDETKEQKACVAVKRLLESAAKADIHVLAILKECETLAARVEELEAAEASRASKTVKA